MYDSTVISNDYFLSVLLILFALAGTFLTVLMIFSLYKNWKWNVQSNNADVGDIEEDGEPLSIGRRDGLFSRGQITYYAFVVVLLVIGISFVSMSASHMVKNESFVAKTFDTEDAVRNIETKYNLSAVELVDESDAKNDNITKLATDSPEFIGIYNDNTVVHFVVAFNEVSGEPHIAVVPPSDGITATQIERSTSRNAPDEDEEAETSETAVAAMR